MDHDDTFDVIPDSLAGNDGDRFDWGWTTLGIVVYILGTIALCWARLRGQ